MVLVQTCNIIYKEDTFFDALDFKAQNSFILTLTQEITLKVLTLLFSLNEMFIFSKVFPYERVLNDYHTKITTGNCTNIVFTMLRKGVVCINSSWPRWPNFKRKKKKPVIILSFRSIRQISTKIYLKGILDNVI